ncbi:AraC family transcriptional regulator [Salibacterium halotolerans]|uniref:Helix-turn-helix domain-containing protein n=1 Tax=Salibacterium halotolerans TaxID=1884432 RepID=A0A1I5P6T5_9BACI|nr:AraC family transcriptional regulator [Salibacterium halotolerans]SFP29819.1 Helix-turn-helix domain-containing protein [Salibacterium halotolerans]
MEKFVYKKAAGITALSASIHDFSYKKHAHEEYAVGVTMRGIQRFHLDGSLQKSRPDGVMLFNPEQAHDGSAQDENGLDYIMLYIKPELLLEAIGKKDIVHFPEPVVYNNELKQSILHLGHAILTEKEDALSSELFLSLADKLMTAEDLFTETKQDTKRIQKAKALLHADLENGYHLDDISKELGLSKYQFIRLFKTNTGISPYQYYLNSKIELAKQIIEHQGDIYSAVAEGGFVDLPHLNRHFKSVYGITAYEYKSHLY